MRMLRASEHTVRFPDDVAAIVRELIGLLESSGTHTGVYEKR